MFNKFNKGFGLLEMVIAITLVSASLFGLVATSEVAFRAASEASRRIRAGFLLEEGFEAVKTIRDDGWQNIAVLTVGQNYYLLFSGGKWSLTAIPQTVDNLFERTIVFRGVFRDAADNIAPAGTNDPNSRKVEISVAWPERGVSRSVSGLSYLTNVFSQ